MRHLAPFLLAGGLLCGAAVLPAQVIQIPPRGTVAQLPAPSASLKGRIWAVTDAVTPSDCILGGGVAVALCQDTGTTWQPAPQGPAGAAGAHATISVGSVTTGAAGSSATVTNSGTSSVAIFDFAIPRGDTGATGAVGATGATGSTGAAGANGATWYTGTTAPSSGTGVNGDYYFRSTTGDVYTKIAGSWGSPIANLTGPTGSTGATGATGPAPSGAANLFLATPNGSSGVSSLRAIVAADVPALNQSTTGNAATATALAANGSNCLSGNYPLGVDASGNAENCTAAPTGPSTYAGSASAGGPATTALATTSAAGIAATVTTTAAPATASATAGVGLTITADPAVAGTTNAGAAKGGDVTVTAGNAARLTSGNANGGAINLVTGSGIGTGAAGNVDVPNKSIALGPNGSGGVLISNARSSGTTDFVFPDAPTQWSSISSAAARINYQTAGSNPSIALIPTNGGNGTYVGIFDSGGSPCVRFSAATNAENNLDASVCRGAGKVVTFGDGGANANGWPQWAGSRQLSANGTNATATLASSGISISVTIGRKYSFQCYLRVANSVAAEGLQVDFGGGTATATDFRAQVKFFDTALQKSQQVTALATAVGVATFTGDGEIELHGSFEPSATGTFIPRYAENTHSTGTATIYRGSNCIMQEGI